uniref:Uncharacterized protein n=1 Tax=Gallus gallus TaxID=9031 RepID=A0A8V0ZAC5_CHICK
KTRCSSGSLEGYELKASLPPSVCNLVLYQNSSSSLVSTATPCMASSLFLHSRAPCRSPISMLFPKVFFQVNFLWGSSMAAQL